MEVQALKLRVGKKKFRIRERTTGHKQHENGKGAMSSEYKGNVKEEDGGESTTTNLFENALTKPSMLFVLINFY